jgi:hypothetical protein
MKHFAMMVLAGVLSWAACDSRSLSQAGVDAGGRSGAGGAADAGRAIVDAAPPGPPPEGLYVTMQDATGSETVFRVGHNIARSCGDQLSALIEPGCPQLSMFFDVHNPEFPLNLLELYVHGAYGFVMRADGALHHRTVEEIAIDAQEGQIVTGHYRLSLDEDPGPANDVWGRFSLCAESGSTIDPCRNM